MHPLVGGRGGGSEMERRLVHIRVVRGGGVADHSYKAPLPAHAALLPSLPQPNFFFGGGGGGGTSASCLAKARPPHHPFRVRLSPGGVRAGARAPTQKSLSRQSGFQESGEIYSMYPLHKNVSIYIHMYISTIQYLSVLLYAA